MVSDEEQQEARTPRFEPFSGGGFHGEVAAGWAPPDLVAEVTRLVDPAVATETIHWGRNYLYASVFRSARGPVSVVVKQFRNLGILARWERRLRGSKATRSWLVARALLEAEVLTPEPLMLVESDAPDGPSFFVCRRLDGGHEVRHFFRRLNNEPDAGGFPEVDETGFLDSLGRHARRLHDAGIWYRDLSMGNVLARPRDGGEADLYVVDFNRARCGRKLGVYRRTRDICRYPVLRRGHREAFLSGYWGQTPRRWSARWWLFVASVDGYLLKHWVKNRLRGSGWRRRHASGGKHHAHIPAAADGASARNKIVWDRLSDQPHQHAGRLEKALIRLADGGDHARDLAIVARAAPAVWRRYREVRHGLYRSPTFFRGIGLCVRPWEGNPQEQLRAIEDVGVRHVLLRLHPWEDDHDAEERLARELAARGIELAFALPQNRHLVRDRARWRAAVEEIGERFAPFGRHFQVGQAINRSKWGVWTRREYIELFCDAAQILRRRPEVELLGPAVIDFEFQFILALVNREAPGLRFDAVSSLLYVDRRGAPENAQLGFDTVDKVALLRAISETGRNSNGRCWITEVNWPLWEGPHSPAGRKVAVDEEAQADYLVRYFLLTLGTGLVERVYWWRLIARGYGLVAPSDDGTLRRRPSLDALRTLVAQLEGAEFLAPAKGPAGAYLYCFRRQGDTVVVGWSATGPQRVELPGRVAAGVDRNGRDLSIGDGSAVEISGSPRYFTLVDGEQRLAKADPQR